MKMEFSAESVRIPTIPWSMLSHDRYVVIGPSGGGKSTFIEDLGSFIPAMSVLDIYENFIHHFVSEPAKSIPYSRLYEQLVSTAETTQPHAVEVAPYSLPWLVPSLNDALEGDVAWVFVRPWTHGEDVIDLREYVWELHEMTKDREQKSCPQGVIERQVYAAPNEETIERRLPEHTPLYVRHTWRAG